MARLQVLVSAEEKEAFREMAEKKGLSLSAWLRQAGLNQLAEARQGVRLETVADLRRFFAECDERESGVEPDWGEHKAVIEGSIRGGASDS